MLPLRSNRTRSPMVWEASRSFLEALLSSSSPLTGSPESVAADLPSLPWFLITLSLVTANCCVPVPPASLIESKSSWLIPESLLSEKDTP